MKTQRTQNSQNSVEWHKNRYIFHGEDRLFNIGSWSHWRSTCKNKQTSSGSWPPTTLKNGLKTDQRLKHKNYRKRRRSWGKESSLWDPEGGRFFSKTQKARPAKKKTLTIGTSSRFGLKKLFPSKIPFEWSHRNSYPGAVGGPERHSPKGPVLDLTLCCHCIKIINNNSAFDLAFWKWSLVEQWEIQASRGDTQNTPVWALLPHRI